jgi:hypothetical protein
MHSAASEAMVKKADNAVNSGQPMPDFRTMDFETLLENWHRFGKSRLRAHVAQVGVDMTHKLPPVNVRTADRILKQGVTYQDIMDIAWKAKQDGDDNLVQIAIAELQRHKNKLNGGSKYDPPNIDSAVVKAVEAERHFNQGTPTVLGVPPLAPFALRSFLTAITHRKPRVAYVARTMSSRLAYLGANLPSNPTSGEYDEFRTLYRRNAAALEKSDDITDVIRDVSADVFGAEIVNDATREIVGQLARKFSIEPNRLVSDIIIEDADVQTKPTTYKNIMDQVSGEERFAVEDAMNDIRQNVMPSVAYVLKGLIASQSARKRFPMITLHGEIVSPDVTMRKGSPAVHFETSVPAEHAKNYVDDVISAMGNTEVNAVRRFTETDNPEVFYASVGKIGGLFGSVRLHRNPMNYIADVRETITKTHKSGEEANSINAALDELELVTDEISVLSMRQSDSEEAGNYLNSLMSYEKTIRKELKDNYGIGDEMETTPVFIRDVKPAVFDKSTKIKSPVFTEVSQAILRNKQGGNVDRVGEIMMELERSDTPNGATAYQALVDMAGSQSQLNKIMKEIGFTSVDVNGSKVLLSSSDMRHIRDYGLEDTDLNRTMGLDKQANSANVAYVDAAVMGETNGDNLMRSVMSAMETIGVSPRFIDAMDKKRRGKTLTEEDAVEMRKAATFWTTRNNGEILANAGMTFISRVFNPLKGGGGHYERHAVGVSKICTPLLKKLNELPDGGSWMSRWFKDSYAQMYEAGVDATGRAIGFTPRLRSTQPQSHTEILGALRRGDRSKLTEKENEVYNMVREYFDNSLVRMREVGMQIGRIRRNYMPQVYRKDLIEADREEFERRLTGYFLKEDGSRPRGPDRTNPLTSLQAQKKAKDMTESLVSDDGVQRTFDLNIRAVPKDGKTADHSFQRVIRLDLFPEFQDPTNPNNLSDYLENDIMVLVSKYSDALERDIDLFKSFGAGHHAVDDYFIGLNAHEGNLDDLIRIIKGKKVDVTTRKVRDPNAGTMQSTDFDYTYMAPPARLARDEGLVARLANNVVVMAQNGASKSDIAEMLNKAYRRTEVDLKDLNAEERTLELAKMKNFKLRAEAIADGAVTSKGGMSPVHRNNQIHAKSFLNAVKRKPINPDSRQYAEMLDTTQKWLTGFNAVTLLPFTVLSSFGDSMLPLVQSGNFQAWARAVRNYATNDDDYREMIRNVGAATENITYKYMTAAFGVDSTKFTNGYFNATGLTPWTEMWRNISAAVGYEHFKMMQRQAMDGSSTRQGRIAKKQLDAYGLQDFYQGNSMPLESAIIGTGNEYDQVAVALNRFTNQSIFTPNPMDTPIWGQMPIGKIVYQLKSFPMMMWRLHRRQWERFLDDPMNDMDVAPLLYMYGAAPAMGFASANVKDIVQGRGGKDNREHKFRERSLADQFSWAENMNEDTAKFLGWYFDGFMMMGGLGLVGEMLYDIGSNVDNGAFGKVRIGEVILGPSMGLFNDGLTVGAGVADVIGDTLGGTSSNYAEREMVDTLFHRFAPPVGSMPSVRERVVDGIAGVSASAEKGTDAMFKNKYKY